MTPLLRLEVNLLGQLTELREIFSDIDQFLKGPYKGYG